MNFFSFNFALREYFFCTQLYDYHVMDQGKSDLCAAEISITLFKKFASFRRVNIELSHIDLDIEKGHANIR